MRAGVPLQRGRDGILIVRKTVTDKCTISVAGPRLTIGELGPVQVPSAKIRLRAVSGPRTVGGIPPLPRPAGLGTVGATEIGTVGATEIGATEVGAMEIGTVGAKEIGAKEIGAKEIGRVGAKARSGIAVGSTIGSKVASRKVQTAMARSRCVMVGEPWTYLLTGRFVVFVVFRHSR